MEQSVVNWRKLLFPSLNNSIKHWIDWVAMTICSGYWKRRHSYVNNPSIYQRIIPDWIRISQTQKSVHPNNMIPSGAQS